MIMTQYTDKTFVTQVSIISKSLYKSLKKIFFSLTFKEFLSEPTFSYCILSFLKSYENICTIDYCEHAYRKTKPNQTPGAGLPSCGTTGNTFPCFWSLVFVAWSYPFTLTYLRVWSCHSPAWKPSLSLHHLQEKAPAS